MDKIKLDGPYGFVALWDCSGSIRVCACCAEAGEFPLAPFRNPQSRPPARKVDILDKSIKTGLPWRVPILDKSRTNV
jgi:hypothetical protein